MNKEKQIEEMELTEVDILANDLNQHCADLAETFCGNTNCLTCLAHALTAKGYRKASEVAREIFEEIEETLNRKIARSKPQFEKLHRDEKDLSIWGYKDMGYFQGIISTCEDMQDIIAELKKKYTEDGK